MSALATLRREHADALKWARRYSEQSQVLPAYLDGKLSESVRVALLRLNRATAAKSLNAAASVRRAIATEKAWVKDCARPVTSQTRRAVIAANTEREAA